MALREKHAWRRRVGLRGSLWYFEEPKKPKLPSVFNQPAAWSTIIAAISAVLTAMFAYNNYLLTKQSYLQTHPPKLVGIYAVVSHDGDGWTYSVLARNDGNTEALNVDAVLIYGSPTDDPRTVNFGKRQNIPAGDTNTLRAGPFDEGPKNDGDLVQVILIYNDSASLGNGDHDLYNNPRRKDMFCGTLNDSMAMLGGCDAVYREDMKKWAPKSTKRP
jgi:hypothetical protein